MSHEIEQLRTVLTKTIAIADDWRKKEEAVRKEITKALAQRDEAHKKLALLFDQVVFSDSLGVPGSSFSVCRWCGGGSGPGGNPGFSHKDDCLFDNDALEKAIAHIWEEASNALADRDAAEALAEQRRVEIERKTVALEACDTWLYGRGPHTRVSLRLAIQSALAPHTEGKETKS